MSKTARILLIDDDADDRELFCEALEDAVPGTICYTISNGPKAFMHIDNKEIETPDLIFLDINMPIMSGWQCLEALKQHVIYRDIPVIMYSTSSFPEEIHKAATLGALCFFSKPFDYQELKNSLRLVVRHIQQGTVAEIALSSPVFMTH